MSIIGQHDSYFGRYFKEILSRGSFLKGKPCGSKGRPKTGQVFDEDRAVVSGVGRSLESSNLATIFCRSLEWNVGRCVANWGCVFWMDL